MNCTVKSKFFIENMVEFLDVRHEADILIKVTSFDSFVYLEKAIGTMRSTNATRDSKLETVSITLIK